MFDASITIWVGNGADTLFWTDRWLMALPLQTLPQTYSQRCSQECTEEHLEGGCHGGGGEPEQDALRLVVLEF
jgi:hypothetical protein